MFHLCLCAHRSRLIKCSESQNERGNREAVSGSIIIQICSHLEVCVCIFGVCLPPAQLFVYLCGCHCVHTCCACTCLLVKSQASSGHDTRRQLPASGSGPDISPQTWQTPATHSSVAALWARRITAWFTADQLKRGDTLGNHHLYGMGLCDVPFTGDDRYKWADMCRPVIRKSPAATL